MKKFLVILCIFFAQLSFTRQIELGVEQPQLIKIYAEDAESLRIVQNIMATFGLYYQTTDTFLKDDTCLYILAGSNLTLDQRSAPDHYIVYHTQQIQTFNTELLKNAIAIWDASWENIARYKDATPHYYFLPNENYQFLDPVVLSCFLPLNALPTYKKLLQYSNTINTDISSHVPSLFCHAYFLKPSIIVEAGVRGGEGSNTAMQAVAQSFNSFLIGVDVNDDSWVYKNIKNAVFFKMDDRLFANHFKTLKLVKDSADFIFIDTSHEFQHTREEIQVFNSILSENGAIGFHDSNVTPLHDFSSYIRLNATMTTGIYGNPRGVAPAIKLHFGIEFDESQYLNHTVTKDGYIWRIIHYPFCNGFTLAKRIQKN